MEPWHCLSCHKSSPICTAQQIAEERSDLSSLGCSPLPLLTRLSFVCAESESEGRSSSLVSTTGWCTWLESSAPWAEGSCSDMKTEMQKHSGNTASHSLTESRQVSWARVARGTGNWLIWPGHPSVSSVAGWGRTPACPRALQPSREPGLHLHSWIWSGQARKVGCKCPVSEPAAAIRAPHAPNSFAKTLECWPTALLPCAREEPGFGSTAWQFEKMPEVPISLKWGH